MPNVYKPGLLQIRPQYTRDPDSGDTPENITWWQSGSAGTPTLSDLQTIQGQFDGPWGDIWKQCGSDSMEYLGSIITDWSSATGLQNDSVGHFSPIAGTAGDPTPPQVAVLQSYVIQLRWRGGHFRTYYPYIGVGALTGTFLDQVTTACQSAMLAAYNTLGDTMAASGIQGGQNQRVYKDKSNATLATLYTIQESSISGTVATQRRRVRHVGRR